MSTPKKPLQPGARFEAIAAAWALNHLPLAQGSVSEVTVEHEHWCHFNKGIGECNCNPTIRAGRPQRPQDEFTQTVHLLVPKRSNN